jgi:site-specific DNA recombinase
LVTSGLVGATYQLQAQRAALENQLDATPPPLPRLHPRLAEIYRDKVATLHTALADPEERDEALKILRSLIDRVVVRPSKIDRSLKIELVGEIANMVDLLPGAETADSEPYRNSVKVVAGEGFEPPTLGL